MPETLTLMELRIPRMGSVEHARLLEWRVTDGFPVAVGDVLYEVETDKVVTEIRADAPCIIVRRVRAAGDELHVGDCVALTAPAGTPPEQWQSLLNAGGVAVAPEAKDEDIAVEPVAEVAAAPAASGFVRASPRVRRQARELGVELASVTATGPDGLPTLADVVRHADAGRAGVDSVLVGYEGVAADRICHSPRRRTIARRLVQAWTSIPMLTADMPIDLTRVLEQRAALNAAEAAAGRPTLSLLAFLAFAVIKELSRFPEFNASWTEDVTYRWKTINLGIAVDSPEGLIVPVIRSAERLDLLSLGARIRDLADLARSGKLISADLEGATFTISNPGAIGPVLRAEAILSPPQVALLGLPGMVRVPVAVQRPDGGYQVQVEPRLVPSLTFDHRAVDGADAVRFLASLKRRLERGENHES